MKRLGTIILLLAALTVPQTVFSQIDARAIMRAQQRGEDPSALYGSNPYDNPDDAGEGEEGRDPADTTKKERKIRKPLESYYFNDSIRALPNFMWTLRRGVNRVDVQPLDTTLADWRIDYPVYRKGVGDASIGGLGQASIPIDAFERPTDYDFSFAQGYRGYTFDMHNTPFYNVKKPYFNMTYLESGQRRYREEHFELTVAQNVSPTTGFNINYRARGTRGLYERQRTKNHNLTVGFNHTGKRYSIHAAYINNHIEQQENGGVVGKWAIADTTFEMPSGVPMRLAGAAAENMYRNNAFFVKQAYAIPLAPVTESDFSLAELPAVYVGHALEYNSWSKVYTDNFYEYTDERGDRNEQGEFIPVQGTYYDRWLIHPERSRDSLSERILSNRLFVQIQPWNRNGIVGTIDGGVGFDMHSYTGFRMDSYLSGRYRRRRETSWYAYGGVEGRLRRYIDWSADVKFYPSGYRGGDLNLNGHIRLQLRPGEKPLLLEGGFKLDRRSAGYWMENLFTNHFAWSNRFGHQTETTFEAALRIPHRAFEAVARLGVISDKLYFNRDAEAAQASGEVSLTSVYVRKNFRLGGLNLDHRVLLQWSSDQQVVPVPLATAYLSYYYQFWVVKNVLQMQVGIDGRYNTRYYAPGYNPALSAFYNQREMEVGNYPYADIFITGKWKRMRIFLKYQHVNKGLFGNGEYFAVARYPLNPGMFKMGISWGFYD